MEYLQHLLKHITAKHLGAIALVTMLALQTHAQNVGVGVDTPQTKLHVAGTLLADSLRLPSGARDGYLLRSDSLGNGFWAPVLGKNLGPTLRDAHQFVNTRPEYIEIQGNHAYVACDNIDSLLVFDLSDPSLPVRIGGIRILFGGAAQGLVVAGDRAYADYSNSIHTIDISDPTNPVSVYVLPQSAEDMAYHNGYLYVVGNFVNGLVVIDAQTPDTLIVVDTIGIGGDPNGIAIEGNHAFIIDAGSLDMKVFDLTNPVSPALVGSTPFGSFPTFIEVTDGFAYVTDNGTDTLYIFDISVPSSPQIVGTLGGFSIQNGLKAHDQLLYMSDSDLDSLYVFDISDPSAPCLLGTKPVPSVPTRMDARGDYIYLLNEGPDRIEVFHIAQNLVTADLKGGIQPFDGQLPGLVTIGSNNFMEHLRLNRIGVGGVHLTAADPAGLQVTSDDGQILMTALTEGKVGIGTDNPDRDLTIDDPNGDGSTFLNIRDATRELLIGTNSSGASLRSMTNHSLSFWTNNVRHMTIDTEGKVGIGTASPIYDLDIFTPHHATLRLQDTNRHLLLTAEANQSSIRADAVIRFYTNNAPRVTINHLGLVGIGETGPGHPLVVKDDITESTGFGGLVKLENSAGVMFLDGDEIDATQGTLFLQNNVVHDISLVMGGGRVGIGTDAPAALLEVSKADSNYIRITSTTNDATGIDLIRSSGSNTDWRIENIGNLKLFSSLNLDNSATEEYSFGTDIFRPSVDMAKQFGASANRWTRGYFGEFIQVSDAGVTNRMDSDASSGLLGTTTDHALNLRTNNATRMHITAAGNVGIGMTSPASRLHLDGEDNNGTTATLQIQSGAQTLLLDGNEIDAITDDLHLQNNSAQNVILVNGGGMVGIGTSTPDRELTVYSPSSTVINVKDDTRELFLGVNSSGGSLRTLSNDELSFWTNNARHMTIETSGEVGIGTSNPTALLEVNATTVKKIGGGSWTASSDIR
ncbi:MAG: hypothetical protein R3301_16410, partial [Saprospiraceae bacterium]|nr:hypothetical protein [Saprospiraceae bacterium]